ncbi:MAG: TRAP transporter small permease subunit, partial [Proteobacteria bacterium]|nr:TRAP transporter small permease subunit [Pseudomonadota bacterium]
MTSSICKYCKKFADLIDQTSVIVGKISSYLVLLSIILITISVILRYFFSQAYVALDEIQYYCYSIMFLFGFSYVYKEDGHIKV